MKVGLSFRETLPKWVADELDRILASISAIWDIEHKDAGGHAAVTADSIVTPLLTVTALTATNGSITNDLAVTRDLSVGRNVAVTGDVTGAGKITVPNLYGSLGGTAAGGLLGGAPAVHAYEYYTGQPAGTTPTKFAYAGATLGNGYVLCDGHWLPGTTDILDLGWGGTGPKRWRDLVLNGVVKELGRTNALGHWQPAQAVFNAAHFTGSGAMTWTVDAGDVVVNSYTLIGKLMVWSVQLAATTIAGTPNGQLLIAAPPGITFSAASFTPGAVPGNTFYVTPASGTSIGLNMIAGNWPAGVNSNYIYFVFMGIIA